MMTAPCPHQAFKTEAEVAFLQDVQRWTVSVRLTCTQCDTPFTFQGLPAGVSLSRPTVSIDSTELRCPVEPQGEVRLHSTATFELPVKETKQ